MKKSKRLAVENDKVREVTDLVLDERRAGDILKELEIAERTQKPPTPELIAKLNEIASRPPFSYFRKARENDTR